MNDFDFESAILRVLAQAGCGRYAFYVKDAIDKDLRAHVEAVLQRMAAAGDVQAVTDRMGMTHYWDNDERAAVLAERRPRGQSNSEG